MVATDWVSVERGKEEEGEKHGPDGLSVERERREGNPGQLQHLMRPLLQVEVHTMLKPHHHLHG